MAISIGPSLAISYVLLGNYGILLSRRATGQILPIRWRELHSVLTLCNHRAAYLHIVTSSLPPQSKAAQPETKEADGAVGAYL